VKILVTGLLSLCALAQQTQPPPADQTQTQPQPPPPAPPPPPYDPSENPFSIGVFGFLPHAHPDLLPGKQATNGPAETFRDLGKTRDAVGIRIAFPAGKGNTLEVTGFQMHGVGSQVAAIALTPFSSTFSTGDLISTNYRMRNIKISWNYLSYPAPPGGSKWRIKTLYEVQYTSFLANFLSNSESSGPITDTGRHNVIFPTLGLGVSYIASKHFHIETKASGFTFPHRSTIGDAEANAVIRAGHVEVVLGYKAYHFRTSPQATEYFRATLLAPSAGIRYVFR